MNALADWRSAADYPPPGTALLARWHWEFLRRNRQYQQDYERFVSLSARVAAEAEERERLAGRYGLDGIMFDFRESLEPLFSCPRRADALRLIRWNTKFVEDDEGNRVEADLDDLQYLSPRLRQHECGIIFSMREPVDVQIDAARIRLESEFKRFDARRGRVEEYVLYLRLLDAEADGNGPAELAEYFFPDVDPRLGRRRVDAALGEAVLLRDVNFRYI